MEICNVLVVDDESFIANSIAALLQCQDQWELDVYKAYSSEDALSLMRSMRVDILITDIRMPGMNGLELARQAQKLWPECIRILLTAYQDFSFAHEAIRDGIDSYLLKTEPDESILAEFARAIARFQEKQERSTRALPAMSDSVEVNGQPFRILLSIPQSKEQTRSILGTMGVKPGELWMLSVDMQESLDKVGTLEWMIREQTSVRGEVVVTCHLERRLFLLLSPNAPVSSLQGALELVQQRFAKAFGGDISSLITEQDWSFFEEHARVKAFFEVSREEMTGYIYQRPASRQDPAVIHDLVDQLLGYIHDHIQEDLSLGMLSAYIGYSPTCLSKLFHEKVGQSLSAYISDMRIGRVKALMRNPDCTLNEISSSMGFSSRSYFNRYVKRKTGLNPREVREALEEEGQG